MDRLDRLGVVVNTGVVPEEITSAGIRIRGEDGRAADIAADSIAIAGRLEAETSLFDAVKASLPTTYAVGDCTGLGLIQKAIFEATRVACAL
jgi:2,4-dienoyl-CoA reductase (NADPH2)